VRQGIAIMKLSLRTALLGFAASCLLPPGALAQRLERPFGMGEMVDGKLVMAADATMGNMIVDQYVRLGRDTIPLGLERKMLVATLETITCRSATGSVTAATMPAALKALGADTRAKLKARDPASLASLSIEILARLDGVAPESVRADEAMGPGVYSDAIKGMTLALDVCGFFGHERQL
jgi:hypothetical protein